MQNLNELQHWFGRAVVRRHLDYSVLAETVVDTEQLSAERRMGIYAEGYQLRLLECMRAEYACLDALLGGALFDQFALNYLNARPSTSYTLFELGAGFAEFLAATRPEVADKESQPGMRMPEQLALLERYRVLSIRGKGAEQGERTQLDAGLLLLQPNWTFKCTDTSFVIDTDFDFARCFDALDREQTVPFPALKPQQVLVYRQGYRVKLKSLQPWQAAFLNCCDGHANWQTQQMMVSDQLQLASGELLTQLLTWLPEMVELGVLSVVE